MTKVEGYKQWSALKCRLAVKNGLMNETPKVESDKIMTMTDQGQRN